MTKIMGDYVSRTVWFVTNEEQVKQLHPERSQRLKNHSPTGFNWGYGGSGPAQLALALLLHYLNDDEKALAHYQKFKFDIIALLPQQDFDISNQIVLSWIQANVVEKKDEPD